MTEKVLIQSTRRDYIMSSGNLSTKRNCEITSFDTLILLTYLWQFFFAVVRFIVIVECFLTAYFFVKSFILFWLRDILIDSVIVLII